VADNKPTLGTAIDQVVSALSPFDDRERVTILGTVCKHLAIDLRVEGEPRRDAKPPPGHTPPLAPTPPATPAAAAPPAFTDIRSLKTQKQPNSARQMACLVAYYLQELAPTEERKTAISTADLDKYFKQANFKLPTQLEQVLKDGKRSGYFDLAARGEYRLTRVGYNLVTHSMPSKSE